MSLGPVLTEVHALRGSQTRVGGERKAVAKAITARTGPDPVPSGSKQPALTSCPGDSYELFGRLGIPPRNLEQPDRRADGRHESHPSQNIEDRWLQGTFALLTFLQQEDDALAIGPGSGGPERMRPWGPAFRHSSFWNPIGKAPSQAPRHPADQ